MKEFKSLEEKVGFKKNDFVIYPHSKFRCILMIFLFVLISLTVSATEIKNGKTASLDGKVIFLTESALISSTITSVSSECEAILTPVTGTSCTATSETVKYGLKLKNTGANAVTFQLSSANEKTILLNNPDKSSTQSDVDLNSEFRDVNNNPITGIEIQPNQEIIFYLLVFVPENSKNGLWNSILVKAVPDQCPTVEITIPIFTYIPDPEKDVLGFVDPGCFNEIPLCDNPEMGLNY
jgi:hypothetical protein